MTTGPCQHETNPIAQAPPTLPPSPLRSTTRYCPQRTTDALGGTGTDTPATTHAYQDNSDVGLRWLPPCWTTATSSGPAPAPLSRQDARGRPSRSSRSGGWRRLRCQLGHRPGSPDPELPAQAEEAAASSQAAAPAALPPGRGPGTQGAETAAPASHDTAPPDHAAAPSMLPVQRAGPARALSASPGAAAAAAEGKEGAKYRAHANPSHTYTSPPKPYPPKTAFPKGKPRPVQPPVTMRTPPGITLPQLRRQQDARRVIQGGTARRQGRVPATGARSGGREATGGAPKDERRGQARAHAARSEGKGTGKAPRPAAAEGGRARAVDNETRDTAQGKRKGTGRTRARAAVPEHGRMYVSRAPKRAATAHMGRSRVRSADGETAKDIGKDAGRAWASAVRARMRDTENGTRSTGRKAKKQKCGAKGPGGNPRARGRWAT